MQLSNQEIDVLKLVEASESAASPSVNIWELVNDQPSSIANPSELFSTLRQLEKKSLVQVETGDNVQITETGLVALRAL